VQGAGAAVQGAGASVGAEGEGVTAVRGDDGGPEVEAAGGKGEEEGGGEGDRFLMSEGPVKEARQRGEGDDAASVMNFTS